MEFLLLEEFLPAARVAETGLANLVVPLAEVEAMDMARVVADKSPSAVKIGKSAFYEQVDKPLQEAHEFAGCAMAESMVARDAKAGIGAFTHKEAMPEWTGD